ELLRPRAGRLRLHLPPGHRDVRRALLAADLRRGARIHRDLRSRRSHGAVCAGPPVRGVARGESGIVVIIEARDLTKFYGAFCALDGVSLGIREGEFVSIIGPNGAGKSTLVNVLTGVLRPSSGRVRFKDQDVHGIGAVALARLGMARSFQLVHIFPDLTVQETLEAAVVSRLGRGTRLFASLSGDRQVQTAALEVAELFGLAGRRHTLSRQLAQGDKKLLDVASAFALRPEVILL